MTDFKTVSKILRDIERDLNQSRAETMVRLDRTEPRLKDIRKQVQALPERIEKAAHQIKPQAR